MPKIIPVFYSNFPDDMHCLQASVKMSLDTIGHPITWEQADKAVRYVPGLYSWMVSAAAEISKIIPGTTLFSGLDYRQFAERGETYLSSYWRPDWYDLQKRKSSLYFLREQSAAIEFLETGVFENRTPSRQDLEEMLNQNQLVICLIDLKRLRGMPGTVGHFVLLYDMTDALFCYHDPGLPPVESAAVDKSRFMYALGTHEAIAVPRTGQSSRPLITSPIGE